MQFQADAQWLDRLLGTIPGFVIVVDRNGDIRYINRVEPGYDRDEVVGTSSDAFLFAESHEQLLDSLERVFRTGETQEYDAQAPLPDGSTVWYRSEMFPLREGERIVAAVIVASNITELKAAEERVASLHKLLPVCSWCDRIRTNDGQWQTLERYVKKTADTDVTHGVCPDCYDREMGRLSDGNGTDG